jgi:hypothetical protein
MFKEPGHIVILVFLIIGVTFTGVGLLLRLVVVPSANADVAELEQMEAVNSIVLSDSRPGKTFLVEGNISSTNPLQYETFVAYIREEYKTDSSSQDDEDDSGWVIRNQLRPPLLLETTGGGPVQITNENYSLQTSKIFEKDSRNRYRGIEAEDHIVVIGELTNSDEPPQLTADLVYLGSRAEYIESQQEAAASVSVLSIIFLVLGILLLVAGVGVVIFMIVQ